MSGDRSQRISERYWLTEKGWKAAEAYAAYDIAAYTAGVIRARKAYREDEAIRRGLCAECQTNPSSVGRRCQACRDQMRRR